MQAARSAAAFIPVREPDTQVLRIINLRPYGGRSATLNQNHHVCRLLSGVGVNCNLLRSVSRSFIAEARAIGPKAPPDTNVACNKTQGLPYTVTVVSGAEPIEKVLPAIMRISNNGLDISAAQCTIVPCSISATFQYNWKMSGSNANLVIIPRTTVLCRLYGYPSFVMADRETTTETELCQRDKNSRLLHATPLYAPCVLLSQAECSISLGQFMTLLTAKKSSIQTEYDANLSPFMIQFPRTGKVGITWLSEYYSRTSKLVWLSKLKTGLEKINIYAS